MASPWSGTLNSSASRSFSGALQRRIHSVREQAQRADRHRRVAHHRRRGRDLALVADWRPDDEVLEGACLLPRNQDVLGPAIPEIEDQPDDARCLLGHLVLRVAVLPKVIPVAMAVRSVRLLAQPLEQVIEILGGDLVDGH